MKPFQFSLLLSGVLVLAMPSAYGQPGPRGAGPQGPSFTGAMGKLFGDNQNFTANMELETTMASGQTMTMPGKIAVMEGKSRFEMDMAQIKGAAMPPGAAAQMKSMGMDKTVMISRPDRKVNYQIFPSLLAYVETPTEDPDAGKSASDFKVETTELGKEMIAGHPCVKSKAIVTDNEGGKHEATIWTASDLHNFPVKIEQTQQGNLGTMIFTDIKMTKPDAGLFEAPADYTKYNSPQTLMQQQMMKRFNGGQGIPARPPQQ